MIVVVVNKRKQNKIKQNKTMRQKDVTTGRTTTPNKCDLLHTHRVLISSINPSHIILIVIGILLSNNTTEYNIHTYD